MPFGTSKMDSESFLWQLLIGKRVILSEYDGMIF